MQDMSELCLLNKPNMCNIYAWDIPKICHRFAWYLSPRYPSDMHDICPKMPKKCKVCLKYNPKYNTRFVWDMP